MKAKLEDFFEIGNSAWRREIIMYRLGTDMIIPPEMPIPQIFPSAWSRPNDLKKSLLDNA
jgi:hypothetical protein